MFSHRPIYEPNQLGNYIEEEEWNRLFGISHASLGALDLTTSVDDVIEEIDGAIDDFEDTLPFLKKLVADLKERKKFNINMNE